MPFLKAKRTFSPNWKKLESLTHRNGYRAAVYGKTVKEKYTGWYKDNMKHGKGFQLYEDGTFYEGDWEFDMRHGYGSLSFICPSTDKKLMIYSGRWINDEPTADGLKSFRDGGLYKGDFKKGKRHGWGIMYYANGDVYTGEWYKDLRHGVGTYVHHETGNYYEGNYKRDKRCGLGKFYYIETGQIQQGAWIDDIPEVSLMRDDEKLMAEAPAPTEFPIPELRILMDRKDVYLTRMYETLAKAKIRPVKERCL